MVDLIVLALLVAGDLPLGLVHQVTDAPQLCALPDRIFHGLGERQAGLPDPLIQASVDCADRTRQRADGMGHRQDNGGRIGAAG